MFCFPSYFTFSSSYPFPSLVHLYILILSPVVSEHNGRRLQVSIQQNIMTPAFVDSFPTTYHPVIISLSGLFLSLLTFPSPFSSAYHATLDDLSYCRGVIFRAFGTAYDDVGFFFFIISCSLVLAAVWWFGVLCSALALWGRFLSQAILLYLVIIGTTKDSIYGWCSNRFMDVLFCPNPGVSISLRLRRETT